jgi:opacity protein-like surface antigen
MRKLLLTAALTVLAMPAVAADMAVKAAATVPAYPYSTSGLYWGVTTFASQTAVNVNAPGATAGQATIDGGSIGLLAGWSTPIARGAGFFALESSISAQNINGSTQQTAGVLSIKGPYRVEAIAKVGMPCANITAYFPSLGSVLPTLPGLPAGYTSALNCHAYIGGGAAGEDISAQLNMNGGGTVSSGSEWSTAAVAKLGQIWQLTNGSAVETWIEYETNGKTFGINGGAPMFTPSIQGQAHRIMLGLNYML